MPAAPQLSTDRLLAFSAVFLSLAALVVSIFQTAILREQQRASVWPRLQVDRNAIDSNYLLTLTNGGVGPALIRAYGLRHAGADFAQAGELSREVIRDLGSYDSLGAFGWYYADVERGEVIRAGQEIELLRSVGSPRLRDALDSVFDPASAVLTIRYADVYGNEWTLRNGVVEER